MAEMYLKVLLIMSVLFAFMIPGFVLRKLKMMGEGSTLALSNILLYVCQPALAVNAFCVFSKEDFALINSLPKSTIAVEFLVCALVSFIALVLVLGLGKLVYLKSKNKKQSDIFTFIAAFSNSGFIGIPFIEMFADGPFPVMYMMVFNMAFSVLCWTAGVVLITGSVKNISLKKVLLNPTIISNTVAIVLFFVPQINIFMIDGLEETQILPKSLAGMTAPLSMIIVGVRLADMSFKDVFMQPKIYFAGALRLIAAPVITFAIALIMRPILSVGEFAAVTSASYVFLSPVIGMAMSPASSVVAMAERFDGDKKTAASAFAAITILSIITIPLAVMASVTLF